MICPYEEEQIALYVSGDLDEAECEAVQAHLAVCQPCRHRHQTFRADAASISHSVAAVTLPVGTRKRRPLRRTAVVAAAAAVLVSMLALWQAPALAEQVSRLVQSIQARHVTAEEADQQFEAHRATEATHTPTMIGPLSPAEAAAAVGHPVAEAGYLPEGYSLERIAIQQGQTFKTILQVYRHGETGARIYLHQTDLGGVPPVVDLRAGSDQVVTVNGQPAQAIIGTYVVEANGSKRWDENGAVTLHFQWGKYNMVLSATRAAPGAEPLSLSEVIKVAESLR